MNNGLEYAWHETFVSNYLRGMREQNHENSQNSRSLDQDSNPVPRKYSRDSVYTFFGCTLYKFASFIGLRANLN